MLFVCVVAQLQMGAEQVSVKPSKVKGSFLLFDEGSVPKTEVKVYSAWVRKPASYNSAEPLDVTEAMMNVKVGKEHMVYSPSIVEPILPKYPQSKHWSYRRQSRRERPFA